MRFSPFLFMALFSSFAFAQLVKPVQPASGVPGGSLGLDGLFAGFQCIFSDITTTGTGLASLIIFIMVGRYLYSKAKEEGGADKSDAMPAMIALAVVMYLNDLNIVMLLLVSAVTFMTYNLGLVLGTIIFSTFVLSGGLCSPYATLIIIPVLVGEMWVQQAAKSDSAAASWINAVFVSVAISMVLRNPSLTRDPLTFTGILVAMLLISVALPKLALRIAAGRFGGEDRKLLSEGFGKFGKSLFRRIRKKKEGVDDNDLDKEKKSDPDGAAADKAQDEEAEDAEKLEQEVVTEELRELEAEAIIAKQEADTGRELNEGAKEEEEITKAGDEVTSRLSALVNKIKSERDAGVVEVEMHAREGLAQLNVSILNRFGQIIRTEKERDKQITSFENTLKSSSRLKDNIIREADVVESSLLAAEKEFAGAEKRASKLLQKQMNAEFLRMQKLNLKIARLGASIAAKSALSSVSSKFGGKGLDTQGSRESLEQNRQLKAKSREYLAKMKQAKSQIEAIEKKLDDWEKKTRKVIRNAKKDLKRLRRRGKSEKKILSKIDKIKGLLETSVKKQGELYARMEKRQENISEKEMPESMALDMAKDVKDFYDALCAVFGSLLSLKQDVYAPFLDGMRNELLNLGNLISRNGYVQKVQPVYLQYCKQINAIAESVISGADSVIAPVHKRHETAVEGYLNKASQEFKEDAQISNVAKAKLKNELSGLDSLQSSLESSIKNTEGKLSHHIDRRDKWVAKIQELIIAAFQTKGEAFESLQKRADKFGSKIGSDDKKVKKEYKFVKRAKEVRKKAFKASAWDRFKAGRKIKDQGVPS